MALTQIKAGAIADDAIDSSTFADGSIDNAHLAANSVDSDQYVDGSIDNAHLADDAVDGDKLANNIDVAGTLDVTGDLTINTDALFVDASAKEVGIGTTSPGDNLEVRCNADNEGILIKTTGSTRNYLTMDSNRSGAGEQIGLFKFDWNGTPVAGITGHTGSDTTYKDDGILTFITKESGTSITEKMRIDSYGNLIIGTTTGGYWDGGDNLTIADSGSCGITIRSGSSSKGKILFSDATTGDGEYDGYIQYEHTNRALRFGAAALEAMRIDSSGNVLIDRTNATSGNNGVAFLADSSGAVMDSDTSYNGFDNCRFRYNGTEVGSITTYTTSTAYNTSSDYRLKENVVDIADGITRVKQLSPKRFNFIADDTKVVDGFLAHEAQTVVPEAITGEKDAMKDEEYEVTPAVETVPAVLDEEGEVVTPAVEYVPAVMSTRSVPDYQGIDQSKLVPLLTAALQEAITKIETLETKVAALEAA